ncbi:MAG: adenine/guanine phosphoribosyltransferase [Halonotius sp. J07HN6]|nr:MAG: adenine/guanine phosphoribosyltransferase [Halonotius sp. J07HN6]ERH05103.1 MAG: adenine/guanine phosphoribosyltransferase [Halonotius sp. J07HN4]
MERLHRSIHEAPIIDKDGYEYIVHPISNGVPMLDPGLLREIVVEITRVADLDVDKIVAPEAMGIHIATALSLQTDIPLVVIRKRPYGLDGEVSLHKTTGYSESEMYINDIEPDDRLLIVDDLLSTGGTMTAICDALTRSARRSLTSSSSSRKLATVSSTTPTTRRRVWSKSRSTTARP